MNQCHQTALLLISFLASGCIEQSGSSSSSDETVAERALPSQIPPDNDDSRCAESDFARQFLLVINELRARGRTCGNDVMPAVAPVDWHCDLTAAARTHSRDMARYRFMNHMGSDGLMPHDRALEAGYGSSFVGENIARSHSTIAAVNQAWIRSPGHCRNIMQPAYVDIGAAAIFSEEQTPTPYWALKFGGGEEP